MEIKFDEKAEKIRERRPRKKKRTMEKMLISYFIISSIIMVLVKHREFHYLFRKYIKGENITIINHRIVELDKVQEKNIIKSNVRTNINKNNEQIHKPEDIIIIGNEIENKRRIEEIEKSLERGFKEREQKIECWIDNQGRKIYTNMDPPGQQFRPCP